MNPIHTLSRYFVKIHFKINPFKVQWFHYVPPALTLKKFYILPTQCVRGSNPRGGARFSAPVQTGPGAHPASYTMGTGSFPGVKRPGRGADHPPPSSPEVKERVELYLYSPSGPSWPVLE